MTDSKSIFERVLTTNDLVIKEDPNSPKIIYGVKDESMTEYLSLPKLRVPEMVEKYIDWMETAATEKVCKCAWAIHPDDEKITDGHCRICRKPKEDDIHTSFIDISNPLEHNFLGRRKRLVEQHHQCPLHTKVGLVLGFFEWVFAIPEGIQETKEETDFPICPYCQKVHNPPYVFACEKSK